MIVPSEPRLSGLFLSVFLFLQPWVDNIKMDLREIGWDGMDWIHLVHDRDQWRALVNTAMNMRVP
jgi:hypothetical protein